MKKFFITVFVFAVASIYAFTFEAIVIKVYDGDTVRVQEVNKKGKFKIRLANIDAPEISQRGGIESKNHLADLVFGKRVVIDVEDSDQYNRNIGTIYRVDNANDSINKIMVKDGFSWRYIDSKTKNTKIKDIKTMEFIKLEREARENKRGIWKHDDNIPPWIYRKENKNRK